ncbi:histidine kinase [Rhizobium sp. CG5]|uniref:sensor histidine kinase n=1 Tax=Rhizobium sp. CG5 TaxID=2726076 RepID=UPI0020334391|nr:sensor histidine kinase [Rhizobium sp. CG5]MCM2473675.1 histidine kinase [Rhizobium sp. CG5]
MTRWIRFFPTTSIGVYLMAMAVLTTLPLLGFVVFLLAELESNENQTLRRETAQDAQTIGRSVERKLQDMATTLRLLSTSPELKTGDLMAFHDRTAPGLKADSLYMLLVQADGAQTLNTRVPFGTALGPMANLPALRSALASGNIEVSDIFFGATSKQWVFNVTMPLPPALSSAGAALVLTQGAGDLASLTATDGLPIGWSAAVLDAFGHVVVSSGPDNRSSGAEFPPDMLSLMTGSNDSAVVPGDGPELMLGYAKLPGWSWTIAVWGPTSSAQAPLVSTWRQLVLGSLLLLGLGIAVAWAAAQQLRRSIRQIADMAERIGEGEIVSPVMTRVSEANQVAIALSNASFDRSQAEERVHFILHELVHRTKNILTLVQAMMRQLAREATSVDQYQKDVSGRLSGLAGSIEALARQQWGGIPLSEVVDLQIATVLGSGERVARRGADLTLNANAVQNLGMVFHELTTNSVKYGALSVPEGQVVVEWQTATDEAGEQPMLTVTWTETGGPPVIPPVRRGFGSTVIERHAAAAFRGKATVTFEPEGLRWSLTGPRQAFEAGHEPGSVEPAAADRP